MALSNPRRVQLLEESRPNRHCEICGESPATITVLKFPRASSGAIQARGAQISRYFCERHRNEAITRRHQLALIAKAEDAVAEASGNRSAIRDWFLELGNEERQLFREIAANTLVASAHDPGRPVRVQQIDPLAFDFSDLEDELRGALVDIAFPAWEETPKN